MSQCHCAGGSEIDEILKICAYIMGSHFSPASLGQCLEICTEITVSLCHCVTVWVAVRIDEIVKICAIMGNPTPQSWPQGVKLAQTMNFRHSQRYAHAPGKL